MSKESEESSPKGCAGAKHKVNNRMLNSEKKHFIFINENEIAVSFAIFLSYNDIVTKIFRLSTKLLTSELKPNLTFLLQ